MTGDPEVDEILAAFDAATTSAGSGTQDGVDAAGAAHRALQARLSSSG